VVNDKVCPDVVVNICTQKFLNSLIWFKAALKVDCKSGKFHCRKFLSIKILTQQIFIIGIADKIF